MLSPFHPSSFNRSKMVSFSGKGTSTSGALSSLCSSPNPSKSKQKLLGKPTFFYNFIQIVQEYIQGMAILSCRQTVTGLCGSHVVARQGEQLAISPKRLLGKIQRLACMTVTGSFRTTPKILQVMVNLHPLDVFL